MGKTKKKKLEYRVSEYITLKVEKKKDSLGSEKDVVNIYIKGKKFNSCKYVLINIPKDKISSYDHIDSIDEAIEISEKMGFKEQYHRNHYKIPLETEFWAHASNLEAWVEYNYDLRLLHSNLSYNLLKRLAIAGDKKARASLKDQIAEKMDGGGNNVLFLLEEGMLDYFTPYELDMLYDGVKNILNVKLRLINYIVRKGGKTKKRSNELKQLIYRFLEKHIFGKKIKDLKLDWKAQIQEACNHLEKDEASRLLCLLEDELILTKNTRGWLRNMQSEFIRSSVKSDLVARLQKQQLKERQNA
jgi:hypothetical protein